MEAKNNKAMKLFEKFGGVAELHEALILAGVKCAISTLYMWKYRNSGIPHKAWKAIALAGKKKGIEITREDLDDCPL